MAITDATMNNDSKLRKAMDRAGDITQQLREKMSKPNHREEPYVLTDAMVERRRFKRVEVKIGLLSYVNSVFRQRTQSDGMILQPSLERFVEELTDLVLEMEQRLCEDPIQPMQPATEVE